MTLAAMSSMERVLTTLGHKEPDRVPFFLLLSMHGAKELGMSIQEYFSRPENVVQGQLRLRDKYRHDCIYAFFYAPLEVEAWGGDVVYTDNGPPNSGAPVIKKASQVNGLKPPEVERAPCLAKVLDAISGLKDKVSDQVPIIGVVMSPFSLPVMQMGFSRYLDLIHEDRELFWRLMSINQEFCVAWANAQLAAGATAICYFDPVSSPTVIPKKLYIETGFAVARKTLARIKGPTATHLASGRCLSIVDHLAQTGTAAVGTSTSEDLLDLKKACQGKLTILGNLNGIEMRRWTSDQAEKIVKDSIKKAGSGGGFILSDNHGEVPWQVKDEVLHSISEAVHRWGNYPISC